MSPTAPADPPLVALLVEDHPGDAQQIASSLVSEHRELVCGMNLALIEGVVEGLDLPG